MYQDVAATFLGQVHKLLLDSRTPNHRWYLIGYLPNTVIGRLEIYLVCAVNLYITDTLQNIKVHLQSQGLKYT